MSKLIIVKGAPGSGKSTKAKELLSNGGTVRLNKDLLRTMLHCDKFNGVNEGLTQEAAKSLARYFLSTGINVIIDDTNLNPKTVASWKSIAGELGAKIEYVDLTDVPVEECIRRDELREKKVGKHVIQKMALQYLDYMKGEQVVICDLDGTLCDIEHRRHFVRTTPKDWKSFFDGIPNDTVVTTVLDQLLAYESQGVKIILVSARPEHWREPTEQWLNAAFKGYPLATALIMREDNDKRPDTETKNDIYEKYLKNLDIVRVYDDRPAVIRMWQSKGLDVVDCGNGEEF